MAAWFRTAFVALCLMAGNLSPALPQAGDSSTTDTPTMHILPQPQSAQMRSGHFAIADRTRLFLPPEAHRSALIAAERFRDVVRREANRELVLDKPGLMPLPERGVIVMTVEDGGLLSPGAGDGYTLSIAPERIAISGNGPAGAFYALQTLIQLVQVHGDRIPAMEIQDAPDFQYRGFYLDISRGKVPTLATLKETVDDLAALKINMLQLYVEHPFAFRFDPSIAQMRDPLTPDDVLALDAYCRDRHMDLVPSLQSFGHMGGALSLPQYKHLADVEIPPWDQMTWRNRMSGATIDMSNPEALALLERMHDEYLPLHTSGFSNVCADETYDLGQGKTKALAEKHGKDTLYLRHIHWLNDLTKKYGKQMMFWGDIVKQHPESIPDIPKDAILLNWGYYRETDFESTKLFRDAGLDFFVCPGTSGWNRILNDVENADLNIRRYAATGEKYGAMGLLNTDWGDHGHVNFFAGSLHGMALGGAMAWNTAGPAPAAFDQAFTQLYFDRPDGEAAAVLRDQSRVTIDIATWHTLYWPLTEEKLFKHFDDAKATALIEAGRRGEALFSVYTARGIGRPWIARELTHASRMNQMMGEKYFLARDLKAIRDGGEAPTDLAARLRDWADRLDTRWVEFRELWLARNREADLKQIEAVYTRLAAEARDTAREVGRKG